MRRLKDFAKRLLRNVGYDLVSYSIGSDPNLAFCKALASHDVQLIVDVGANTGQYGLFVRRAGYNGPILSFEPMKTEHELLLRRSKSDSKWTIAPPMAIGDHDGLIEINIASNSGSSSLLPMLELHMEAAPESAYIGTESVQICRLDTIVKKLVDDTCQNLFLKIDVQGSEWSVLDGANETLSRVAGILCECSFTPLYSGEAQWLSLVQRIEGMGFEIWGVSPGFSDERTGRLLQADFLFFRRE
jgi:FkbM family methyltransferase